MTTWGYYQMRGKRGDEMKELLSEAEKEKRLKAMMFAKARERKLLGLPSKAELERRQHDLDTSKGICPICHMQRSITGVCSC